MLDIGFLAYDVAALAYDEAVNAGESRTENLTALGLDAAATITPFATGLGVASRVVNSAGKISRVGQVRAAGYHFHHIVPQQLANHPALALTGFDIAGYANKMALPGGAGLHRSRTVHSGMHRKEYTERLRGVLNDVEARVKSGELTPAQGHAEIQKAVANERKGLRAGETSLNGASDAAKGKSAERADKGGKGERDERDE